MAGCSPAWPGAWSRWLPVGLPANSLAALMSEWSGIRANPNARLQPRPNPAQLGHPCARHGPSRRALETASAPSDGLVAPDRTADAARNAIVADGRQCTTTDLTVSVSGIRLHPRRTPRPGLSNRTPP